MENLLNINLSAARGKDEDFTTYKNRLKSNKKIVKLYKQYGREAFKQMFPNGVSEALENNAGQTQNESNSNVETSVDVNNKWNLGSQKVNKSQNVSSKAPTQMRKSGRGK
jgi:hypothetical protein